MIKTDCAFFPLDRPCIFHKQAGVKCQGCAKYIKTAYVPRSGTRILVIKLDAMGDVLRTTFILEGLFDKYPKPEITWIVAKESRDILENNRMVKNVWIFDKTLFTRLLSETFDVIINLDLSPLSLSLSTLSLSKNKIGFSLSPDRKIIASNSFAVNWLEMSAFDDLKKANDKTYQWWMSKIIGLKRDDYEIQVPLVRNSLRTAEVFAKKHRLAGEPVLGINPGAGKRWKLKRWTVPGYLRLINEFSGKARILLLGGPDDAELIELLKRKSGRKVISTGTNNSLLDFFALTNLCDVIVAGDTLALHTALGLKKKAVAIFGPTSSNEVEMYGRGTKIVSSAPCICCYLQNCYIRPDCMKRIKADCVIEEVRHLLELNNG